jgi:hypothetical protein
LRATHLTPALSPHPTGGEGEWFAGRWKWHRVVGHCGGQRTARPASYRTLKSSLHPEFGLRERSIISDAVFHGNAAGCVFAQRGVNESMFVAHMTVDDGEVFLLDGATLQDFAQFARHEGTFCNDDHTTGFAIKTIYEMG